MTNSIGSNGSTEPSLTVWPALTTATASSAETGNINVNHNEKTSPQLLELESSFRNKPATSNLMNPSNQNPNMSRPGPLTNSELDKYTVAGIVSTILKNPNNLPNIALGEDITRLGLDLNRQNGRKKLCETFSSPWEETSKNTKPSLIDPNFFIPSCYFISDIPPAKQKLSQFTDETLFYIFYVQTRDEMQMLAARELSLRNWRFHKEWRLWLIIDSVLEQVTKNHQQYQRSICIFWDPVYWDRVQKEVSIILDDLEDRSKINLATKMEQTKLEVPNNAEVLTSASTGSNSPNLSTSETITKGSNNMPNPANSNTLD